LFLRITSFTLGWIIEVLLCSSGLHFVPVPLSYRLVEAGLVVLAGVASVVSMSAGVDSVVS
jgi:hypothetical protein